MSKTMLTRLLFVYRAWIYRALGYAAHHPHGTWIVVSDAVWLGGLARKYHASEDAQAHTRRSVGSARAAAARAQRVGVLEAATDDRVAHHLREAAAATGRAIAAVQNPPRRTHRARWVGLAAAGAATGGLVWLSQRRGRAETL